MSEGAIRWRVEAPQFLTERPYVAMCIGVQRTYAKEHERTKAAHAAARADDPAARYNALAPMMAHVSGDEWPGGVGLSSFHCMGCVPPHADTSFLPWSYLYLIEPGGYVVADERLDLTPQAAGTLICFNDHERHMLFDPEEDIEFLSSYDVEAKCYKYPEVPGRTWVAFTFDMEEQVEPEQAIAALKQRMDAWWGVLDLRRAA